MVLRFWKNLLNGKLVCVVSFGEVNIYIRSYPTLGDWCLSFKADSVAAYKISVTTYSICPCEKTLCEYWLLHEMQLPFSTFLNSSSARMKTVVLVFHCKFISLFLPGIFMFFQKFYIWQVGAESVQLVVYCFKWQLFQKWRLIFGV